jgi:hypothetical protein
VIVDDEIKFRHLPPQEFKEGVWVLYDGIVTHKLMILEEFKREFPKEPQPKEK